MVDLEPAFRELAQMYRVRETLQVARASDRAANSTRPGAAAYKQRKAAGLALNGRGDRASPGAGPLTVTGRAKEALLTPQTLDIRPTEMYLGVRVRDASGRFGGELAHLVPINRRFSLSRRLSRAELNDWSQVVLRHLEAAIGGA